jgi:hypothetical protein
MTDESGRAVAGRLMALAADAKALEAERNRLAAEVERLMIQCAELMGEVPKDRYIEGLHEALLFYEDPRSYVAENPDGARIWRDHGLRARRAMNLPERGR